MAKDSGGGGSSLIAKNKKAFHDYEVLEHLECGVALQGTEVKSLRQKNVSFADSYAIVRDGELLLLGLNIPEYIEANRMNHTPTRTRKLLAHKRQIRKLDAAVNQKGLTLVPLSLYWREGRAKVDLGLVRGKARVDKRETLRNRDIDRQRQRALRRGTR